MDCEKVFDVPTKELSSPYVKISDAEPCKTTDYRFPTMKLFPLLLDTPTNYEDLQVSPSIYLKEMSYTTEERFKELTRGVRQVVSLPDYPGLVHFKVTPSIILFQNVAAHTTTTLTLAVTNSSRVSRHLKMSCETHPNIRVKYRESAVRKLAAGMTVKFNVEYTPSLPTDYFHKITFTSEDEESFIVPIIALSPRQMLDLPDRILLPITPVKVESKKTLIIRNISCCMAVANFFVERPFKIDPDKIYLGPDEIATVTVTFCTPYLGNWKNKITVIFETGEKVVMTVEGSSELGNVYLSCARVDIPDTYMNMKRQGIVSVHNSSDYVVSFQWHLFKSVEDDHKTLSKLKSLYEEYQEIENNKVAKLVHFDLYDEDIHQIICGRITRDNINLATSDSLYFNSKHFNLFPIKGEIWPGGVCKCTVVFSSESIGKFETFTFLEIDGLESRLPLCLSASAIGPKIKLNIDSIDTGEIHVLQVFSAQVIVENIGNIAGSVCFISEAAKPSSTISCSPLCYRLEPGQSRPYLVSVSRSSLGIFNETITFQIDESRVNINCVIKGKVIIPPLEYSDSVIDFGAVPLGFEVVKTVRLINPCSQPFGFSIKITGYWEEEAIRAWDKQPLPSNPKQFSVYPSDGLIKPYQQLEIKVVGLLNMEDTGSHSLKLLVWDNSMDHLTLPIHYSISALSVRCLTPEVFIDFTFLNYVYEQEIQLINDSDSTSFYTIYSESSNRAIECTVKENDGVILPYGEITVNLCLKIVDPGKHKTRIMMKSFGNVYPVILSIITMNGIHPVLNLEPMELEMGEVVVLVPTKKTFTIVNVSPISTEFCIKTDNISGFWSWSENSGVVQGNSKHVIEVVLRLHDPGPIEDTLMVSSPGTSLRLKMTAVGIGCAIITAPCLCPSFNLGHLISSMVHEIEIMIINKSSATHELMWSTCENLINWTKAIADENQGDYISIIPYRMTLKPGQMEKVVLTAYCEEEKTVQELYYCVGVAGVKGASQNSHCRKTLGESLIQATFVNPRLKMSKNEISFCVRVAPDDPFPLSPTDTVKVTPEFNQEIVLEVKVKAPFKIVREDGLLLDCMSIHISNGTPLEVTVMFDTSFKTDCYSWAADDSIHFSYKNHSCKAILPLHGEVQYPNIVLSTHLVDFGGIHKYSESYREIVMKNMSPYDVQYSWEWCDLAVKHFPSLTEITEDKSMGSKSDQRLSEFECVQGPTSSSSQSKSISGVESKSQSHHRLSSLLTAEPPDVHSIIREVLNIIISDAQYPEDCDIDEEDRMALRDIAFLLKNNEGLFEKFSSLLIPSKESSLLPTTYSESQLFILPNRIIHSAISHIKRLEGLVIRDETLAGFQDAVVPFLSRFIKKQLFEPVVPVMPVAPHNNQPSVSNLVDLTPKWGVLLSGQQQVIGALFKPKENVEVNALAICKIYGGPAEKVSVRGICSEAKYSFSRQIDLGFIPFCEFNTFEWKVFNECCINIAFRIIKNMEDVITVEPMDGFLKANSEFCFNVICLPGCPGPVQSTFHIELATLEVAKVEVRGMSVMSQVVLDLPEKESDVPVEMLYQAVASLTHPAFVTLSGPRRPTSTSSSHNSRLHESISSHSTRSKLTDLNGFQLIGYPCCQENIPSLIDLKLAFERQMMASFLRGEEKLVKIHASSKSLKRKYFTDCLLAPYQLEFGSVIFDTTVVKTVEVYNYGYLDAQVSLSLYGNEDKLKKHGINFSWNGLCNIEAGGVGSFTVTLNPTSNHYPGCFYNLNLNFILQVACGCTLPIEMRAYFVQPEISMKKVLEFGELKCGHTQHISLTLSNISTVDAEWTLSLRTLRRKNNEYSVASFSDSLPCPFFFDKESGLISPGQSDIIIVSFLPIKHGLYERVLEIKINQSRSMPKCKLRGTAVEPYINVNQLVLDFGTVYPYSFIYEQDITLHNPCPFAIQVTLADFDSEAELENRVLRAMCHYYKTDRMQLPLKYYDTNMSPLVVDMYNSMARLGGFLRLTKIHSNMDTLLSDDNVVNKKIKKSGTPARGGGGKLPSAKGGRKKSLSVSKGRRSTISAMSDEKTELDQYLAEKTPSEIDDLVNEYIDWLHNIPENDLLDSELMEKMNLKFDLLDINDDDDSKRRFSSWMERQFELVVDQELKDPYRKGTILIFYGAPFTDYVYLAHNAARQLTLKPVTLDSLILEEAAYTHGPGALLVRELVNNAYNLILEARRAEKAKQDEEAARLLPPQVQPLVEQSKSFPDQDLPSVCSLPTSEKSEGKSESDIIIDPLEDLEMKITAIIDHAAEEARKKAEEAAALAFAANMAVSGKQKSKNLKEKDKVAKSDKSTASKSTKESSKISKKDIIEESELKSDTFLDIGMEIIQELICHRMKLDIFDKGIIVDNLTGLFIKNAAKSLEMLLSIAGPTKNIYFINVNHSYENMNILRNNQKKSEEMRILKNAEDFVNKLKQGSMDQSVSLMSRKSCYETLDLYHNTAVQLRNEIIMQRILAEEMAAREAEISEASLHPKTGASRMKYTRGTSHSRLTSIPSSSSTAKPKSHKSGEDNKKSKTALDKKNKRKSKPEPEPEPEEEVIPPEEIKIIEQFKYYTEDFTKIVCILDKHDRLKVEGDMEQSKRSSVRSGTRKGSRSRIYFGAATSVLKMQSPKDKEKPSAIKEPPSGILTCPVIGEEVDSNAGVPLIILNNANIKTELNYLAQISGLKSVIPPLVIEPPPRERAKSNTENDMNNKNFWYDKPEIMKREKLCKAFHLENKATTKEMMRKETNLNRVKPHTSMPALKELQPTIQPVRRVSPLTHTLVYLNEKRVSVKMFKKKLDSNDTELITRKTLSTSGAISWTVSFYPEELGRWKQDLHLGITGWAKSGITVRLEGLVQLPDIMREPEAIFTDVVGDVLDVPKKPCFIKARNVFDFGFVFSYAEIPDANRSNSVIKKIKLTNARKLTAHLNFSLNLNTHFDLEPSQIDLKAGEHRWLLVECNPRLEGTLQDQLFCSILNNPEPLIIQLCCTGVKGQIFVKPKDILFDKVLIKHSTTKTIVLSNTCGLPLHWLFKSLDDITHSLTCSQISGCVEPFGRVLIHFSYKALQVEVLDKPVTLQVYDKGPDDGGVLIQTMYIPVKGESYDIIVNICFPDSETKQLEFGDIKVEVEHTRSFFLENKGHYEIDFKIEFEQFPQAVQYSPSDIFSLSLSEGVLPVKSKVPFKVSVSVKCLEELVLDESPMLKVCLFEKNDHVANISIPVSLCSHYTKFRLVPKDEVGFGSVLVGETKVLFLTIENIGHFEFKYVIISKAELDQLLDIETIQNSQVQDTLSTFKESQDILSFSAMPDSNNDQDVITIASKTPEPKSKKQQSDKKYIGPFTVHGVSGLVKRETSVKIKITCSPNKEANFKEVILIQASELPEAIRYGLPVNLLASGCLPSIDFSNISLMYKEAIIVSDSNKPQETDGFPAVIYSQDSGLLFQNVVVSTSKVIQIYLQNIGMVSSTVKTRIQAGGSVRSEYFSVDAPVLHIAAYATEVFSLKFSPMSIELSEGVLEMELEIPHSKPVIHRVSLSGRGCLPLVELISPIQVKSCVKSDKSVIDMGTCLLEFHLSNILTFRNCGKCQCKFILELMSESDSNCFSLAPLPHCKELITSLDDGKNERLSCGLGPEKEVQLSCVFAPVVPVTCVSSIKVLIVDNPYEQYKILLCGRGHMDNVTLEGIPFLLDPTSSSYLNLKAGKAGKSGGGGPSNYLLDFGQAYVGQPVKQEMKLRNHSDCWLRYTWDLLPQNQQGLTIYPRLGCLPPKSSTMMYAVLLPTVPSRFTKVLVKCNLEKVILIDPCTEWSSHDKLVAWLRHEDKYLKRYDVYCNIAENEDEPVYSEIIKMGELKLQVQVEADKPIIVPDVLKISFPDTLICQGTSSIIRLKNPSRVEARFSYQVNITRAVPSHFEAEPVFSSGKLTGNNLYPNTGQIEDTCTSPSTTSSKGTKRGKSVSIMSGDIQMKNLSTRSELSDIRESMTSKKREEYSSCPFIVTPETCILQSGTSCEVEIDFIPMQMFAYNAQVLFTLEGVDENTASVDIEGTGLTSYCHLEIDNVEFDSEQEYPDRTKAIIIDCIGIPASYNKKFSVINPTDKEYHFEWIKTDRNRTKDGIYEHLCATPSGLINPHKSYDMDFNFFSVEEGKFETLWLLRIPEMDMEQYVLFITSVREPLVKLSSPDLKLKPTIAGLAVTGEISLRNEEDVELKFKVDKCSLFSEGRYEKLDMEPASGVLPPLTSFIFRVSLTPKRAGDTNFLVRLQVAKKKEPMLLRVSTCCYSVEALVTLCPEGTSQPIKLITDMKNHISLGHMELKVPKRVVLKIRNTGRAGFYVELTRREVQTQWKRSYLQLDYEAKTGFISPGTKTTLDLIFSATAKTSFNNLPMTIKILKGPEYEVLFSGDAAGPEYIFNFSRYEFGPRLIQTSNNWGSTAELIFRNEDEVSLEIEKLFKDTDIFKVELEYSVVPPRSALTILVKFYPREMTTYSSDIEFLINGIYSNIVNFTGTGVPLKVDLVRPKDKLIDFSTVLTGQTVCRSVEIINRSERSVTLRLVTRLASKDNYLLNVKPKELFLPTDKICKFTLTYTPLKRGINMTEKIWFECEDHSEVLVVTEGRGVGPEFRLDRDMIPFGLAIVGSSNTVKLALINSGDFGARFAWDFSKASECFKITPKEGYSTPGSILTFELSFTPKSNTPRSVRNQVTCNVENLKAPISLVLTGSCADVPPPKDFIKFNSPVRQKTIKPLPIFNHTSEKWVIYPTISGDSFTGEAIISILPKATANYEITYYPTAMAKKKSNHEGSVFLAFPDGQSILYGLKGQANPPESEKQVTWITSAKKNFIGKLPIKNWLGDQSQRFTVQIKAHGEGTKSVNKNLYKIFGNAQIEVAPSATREYDVHFFSYLSTTLNFIVTYTNDADGEYAWLELTITVTEPDVLENYHMETQVRKPVVLQLPFSNPMDNKQTLTCDTLGLQISVNTPLVLPPKQTSMLTVSYFPVTEEEERVEYLVIKSAGLGDFNYRLYLTARPALLPPVVNLTASLGRNHAHTFTVTNHTHYDTTFSVQVDSKSLICPKEVKVRAMNSESIIILYEPFSEITEDVILIAASDQAGSFKFPLCLTGTSPVPRGPFDISPGGSLPLSFKNIFHEAKEFIMTTESELFTIKIPKRQIKPKQEGEFLVQMVKKDEIVKGEKVKWKESVIASKVIITPADANLSNLCWVYYIRSKLT